jgi:uncharacterized membrane protein YbhN (UPF0104 family)
MRRPAKVIGAVAAAFIIGWVLYRYGGEAPAVDWSNSSVWRNLTGAVALYVVVQIAAARVWKLLIVSFGVNPKGWTAESQLLTAQVGKYLPGNVAHLAGRVALAIKDGVPAAPVGLALVAESALTVAAGLAVATAGLWLLPGLGDKLNAVLLARESLAVTAVLLVAVLIAVIAGALTLRRYGLLDPLARLGLRNVLVVVLIQCAAFVLLGGSLHLVAAIFAPAGAPPLLLSIVVFAVAWVAGLITPGAPGGLGVRESIITLGLGTVIGAPAALTVALLHRAVSVTGDVIAFGLGCALRRR